MKLSQRAQNTGCWAIGIYAIALFFAFGALVSFLNVDLVTAIQGALLAALFVGVGIWFARKHYLGMKRPGSR